HHHRILGSVHADARVPGVADHVVAHDAADGLVVLRVRRQIEVLGTGVEADQDAGVAGVLDAIALDHHVARTALEVEAGGRRVVDVAVLDQHAVAVDVVDAVGIAAVPPPGAVDLDAADDGAVRLGRDLDAVAAGAVDQ